MNCSRKQSWTEKRVGRLRTSGKVRFFSKNWKIWQKSNKFQNVFLFRTIQKSSNFFEQKFELFLKKSSNKVWRNFEETVRTLLSKFLRDASFSDGVYGWY
jgi:hypothetical protein